MTSEEHKRMTHVKEVEALALNLFVRFTTHADPHLRDQASRCFELAEMAIAECERRRPPPAAVVEPIEVAE